MKKLVRVFNGSDLVVTIYLADTNCPVIDNGTHFLIKNHLLENCIIPYTYMIVFEQYKESEFK